MTKLRLINSGRRLIWTPRGMPWCPLSELAEKNVTDTCVIDIKTKNRQRGRRVGTVTAAKGQGSETGV